MVFACGFLRILHPVLVPATKRTRFINLLSSPENQTLATTHQHPSSQAHLRLLRNSNNIESLNKAHALLIVNGFVEAHSLIAETINKYLYFGDPELALATYRTARKPTLLLQNLTIRSFSHHGFYSDLLSLYSGLQRSGQHCSDHYTFPFVIKACAALLSLRTGREIHCAVLRTGYSSNVGVQTTLLDMYAKNEEMESAKKVFDGIPDRDRISWNTLISGYSSNGFHREAFETFQEMQAAGLNPSGSTFVSIIPVCTALGALRVGRSLHGLALVCGAFSDEALGPTLISMYSGCEDLSAARMLFEMLPGKDIVAWNAMISAYAQSGKSDEAIEVFRLMHSANMRPNVITMVSVISSSGHLLSIHYGESVQALGIKLGLSDQNSIVSALVSMYANLGELDAAQYLFHSKPVKELLLWNSMISSYILNGLWYLGLDTFRDLQLRGMMPDAISLINVVSACTVSRDLHSGKAVHAYGLKNGFDLNTNVMNALLAFYSDCDKQSSTIKLFHKMPVRNVISWNTLISGWAKIGDTKASVVSFNQMRHEDVKFDMITVISILPSFYQDEDLACGMSFHALVIKNGYESDVSLTNSLISLYANYGDVEAAYLCFDGLSSKSAVSWNALMTGCRNHNLFGDVMVLFDQMKKKGQKPNSVTLLNILPVCESQSQGKSIHSYAVRNLSLLESTLITSIMNMYARFGNVDSCRQLFEMVDKRSGVAWNILASAYLQSKLVREAVTSFIEMLRMGVEPDPVTILNLVSACSHLGSVGLAQCVIGFAVRKGLKKNTSVINSLIDMYARFGSVSIAKYLFDGLEEKDSITWSVMINAYGMHGDGEAALGLFLEMRRVGFEPDDITFISILSACSHAGLVEEARILFESMSKEHQIAPRMEHYACMVDLFSRKGLLNEAYDLVKRLPFRLPASLLECLLGACQFHGNVEVGEKVAKLLIECIPPRPSSYVMLSNINASAEKWMDSNRLRSDMEGKGLRKNPGVSCIKYRL